MAYRARSPSGLRGQLTSIPASTETAFNAIGISGGTSSNPPPVRLRTTSGVPGSLVPNTRLPEIIPGAGGEKRIVMANACSDPTIAGSIGETSANASCVELASSTIRSSPPVFESTTIHSAVSRLGIAPKSCSNSMTRISGTRSSGGRRESIPSLVSSPRNSPSEPTSVTFTRARSDRTSGIRHTYTVSSPETASMASHSAPSSKE